MKIAAYYFCLNVMPKRKKFFLDKNFLILRLDLQKQPFRGVLRKRCSEIRQQTYRRALIPKCDFNQVALQLHWNQTSACVSFPVNLLHIFRTHFYKNTYRGLPFGKCSRWFHFFGLCGKCALPKKFHIRNWVVF